jgi:hypothetical protein
MNRGAVEMIVACVALLAVLVFQAIVTMRTGRMAMGRGAPLRTITKESHPKHYLVNWCLLLFLIAAAAIGLATALIWPEVLA